MGGPGSRTESRRQEKQQPRKQAKQSRECCYSPKEKLHVAPAEGLTINKLRKPQSGDEASHITCSVDGEWNNIETTGVTMALGDSLTKEGENKVEQCDVSV